MFEETKKNTLIDFGFFPGDLRQRGSFTDLGFGGFPLTSSVSNGFHFSGDRTSTPITNPFLNLLKLDTTALMADGGDMGLCQNLSKMRISDDKSSFFTPVLNHSGFYGSGSLHGFSNLDQPREGLVRSFHGEASMRGYGDFNRFDQDLRVRHREGLVQSFHGESSMGGYVGDGDYQRQRLLGFQEAHNPNPSFNLPRGHNRDYMFEHFNQQIRRDVSLIPQKSRLAFQQNDVLDPLMYSGNRAVPPFLAMGGSRELGVSTKPMKNNTFFKEDSLDMPLNLESMVDIYGSVYLMAKDQLGCRLLQKLVEEGSFVDVIIVFKEVINHVSELGMDPFGNYFIQKLIEVCNEEQRTQILIRLTSKPGLLVKISINTYG